MSKFWSPILKELSPYVPGEQPKIEGLIKLNTNENPYPPSPLVAEAIQNELIDGAKRLRLYPDPNADFLKRAILEDLGDAFSPAQIFVGNGSDEVLAFAFQALLKHEKPLLFPDITYSFYPTYAKLYGIDFQTAPLADDFSIDIKDYQKECGAVILANPNAPTGRALTKDQIEKLCAAQHRVPVVIDEAYIDFGGQSAVGIINRNPNLLVVRTLSKSHALAGLRVGYAIGNEALIEGLERVKNSFNSYPLDRLAIVGAAAAIRDKAYLENTRQKVMKTRENLSHAMEKLGFSVLPSSANFIFARHLEKDAATLAAQLREAKIIVRHFKAARIDQFLRISIGTDEECKKLVDVLKTLV